MGSHLPRMEREPETAIRPGGPGHRKRQPSSAHRPVRGDEQSRASRGAAAATMEALKLMWAEAGRKSAEGGAARGAHMRRSKVRAAVKKQLHSGEGAP